MVVASGVALSATHPGAAKLFNGDTESVSSPLTWGSPSLIDNHQPLSDYRPLSSVSCPTTELCMVVDNEGRAVITTEPTAATPAWSAPTEIDPRGDLASVSCPTTHLCVTVDDEGRAVVGTSNGITTTTSTTTTSTTTTSTTTSSTTTSSLSTLTTTTQTSSAATTTATASSTSTSSSTSSSTSTITTGAGAPPHNPPTEIGCPKVNPKTGEVQVQYSFPEPGGAEAYGEVIEGANVARVPSYGASATDLSPFALPLTATEADLFGVSEATRAKAKSGKCPSGYAKQRNKRVNNRPVKFGLVKLAILKAGAHKIGVKPTGKVLAALKQGKTLPVQISVAFIPAGTTTRLTQVSSVAVHIKAQKRR